MNINTLIPKAISKDFNKVKKIYLNESNENYAQDIASKFLIRLFNLESYESFVSCFEEIPLNRIDNILQSMLHNPKFYFYGVDINLPLLKEYIKVYGPTVTTSERTAEGYRQGLPWTSVKSKAQLEFEQVKEIVLEFRKAVVELRKQGKVEKGTKPSLIFSPNTLEDLFFYFKHEDLILALTKIEIILAIDKLNDEDKSLIDDSYYTFEVK
jgi:hypothetical protein